MFVWVVEYVCMGYQSPAEKEASSMTRYATMLFVVITHLTSFFPISAMRTLKFNSQLGA